MKTYPLSATLVQTILNYLGTRPFNEVVGMIAELQKQCALVDQPTPPAPPSEITTNGQGAVK